LPTFDSVWIDGLVQTRQLTALQAQYLETGKAERLVIGPCVLLERLGGTALAETFLARRRDANDVCVLKLTSVAPEHIKPLSDRLAKLTSVASDSDHVAVALPQATQVVEWPSTGEWRLVTISRHVRGPHLAELLIRRGRVSASVVIELGRQLLDGLVALEARGLVHGDIGLANARITPSGQAVLVDAGLVPALRPEFSFHTILAAERYEGLAPERISTGQPPSVASDLYALGCLLWHLLAGRPPFPVGDPLAKLAAHQTQPIADVRDWVPDAPEWFAETLRCWTAMNPAARPQSFREAAASFGSPTRAGRRRLAHFRGEFDRTLPRRKRAEPGSRWPLTVAAIFVMSGAALSMFDQKARNFLLAVARPQVVQVFNRLGLDGKQDSQKLTDENGQAVSQQPFPSTNDGQVKNLPHEPQPLPHPTAAGRIVLPPSGRFLAADVSARGTLEIIGDRTSPPEIVVTDRSLSLWAEHIQLRHVRIVRQPSDSDRPPPLVVADCQQIEVIGCRFEQDVAAEPVSAAIVRRRGAALAWRPQEPRDRDRTRLMLQDVFFVGDGAAVYLHSPPAMLSAATVLKVGAGDVVQLRDPGASEWRCELHQITLRECGPLLRCWPGKEGTSLSRLTLSADGCVFDVARGDAVSPAAASPAASVRPALIAWMSRRLPPNWTSAIDWQMSGVLVPPEVDMVTLVDLANGRHTPIDETRLSIDGIVAAPFEFVGAATSRPNDSQLRSFDAPLPSPIKVGIQAERLK